MMSYYYTHNSRGDIIGIYNGDGVLRAQYKYDAWGNILSVTDGNGNAITSATHVGNLNPFRYRGYYYDTESGFYYLMSRYYDPVIHRFINADGYFQAGGYILDANMHAYCGNNSINNSDPTGLCYVAQYTNAGTYIGTYWVIKTAVPGAPGFCNNCKSYDPNSGNSGYAGYSEHNKKGTTNPSNKNKHQKGQKRKQTDKQGGEKGDARRPVDRSNKRHYEVIEPTIEFEYTPYNNDNNIVTNIVVITAASLAIVYFVANDATGVGVLDDAAIVPLAAIIWDTATNFDQ